MAQFESPTYVAQSTAAGNAAKLIDSAELISGKVSFLQCEVAVPAGTATNDTILAGFIPSGMTIVPGQVTITTQTSAGANTFKVGTVDQPTAVASAAVANTTGNALLNSTVASFKNTKRQALVLTLNGALTNGGKFFINIPLVNSN